MIVGAPAGFVRYETEFPDQVTPSKPEVLSDDYLDRVNELNRYWNQNIIPTSDAVWAAMDPEHKNWWHILNPGDSGPCTAFSVTKRKSLEINPGALSLAICHRNQDGDRLDHMVLLVNFASGIRVLDSLFFDFYPLADCDYEMISRQTWGNPQQWETMQ